MSKSSESVTLSNRPPRRVSGIVYAMAGAGLFVFKLLIDTAVAQRVFQRDWSLQNYILPNHAYTIYALTEGDIAFFLAMIGIALPFMGIGVWLTVGRLRDAAWPAPLVILFFVPLVNLLFFLILSFAPSKQAAPFAKRFDPAEPTSFAGPSLVPAPPPYAWTSNPYLVALAIAPLGPLSVLIGVLGLNEYGWGLFIGEPFVVGLLATMLYTRVSHRSAWKCFGVSMLALLFSGIGVALFALEGIVCLVMLFPLAAGVTALGTQVGFLMQKHKSATSGRGFAVKIVSVLVTLPLLMGAESLLPRTASVFVATTSIDIDAPPEKVWNHVVRFSEIPEPKEWLFATGLAYPVRARIEGTGVGATRYCEFSTGPFVEPITEWDRPRKLAFTVTSSPPPLREWSPWDIHPPHLNNFLVSHGGQFELIPLNGGRTRLRGTTWYEHNMYPESYWKLWSDFVIHRIHWRVLNHIKAESER